MWWNVNNNFLTHFFSSPLSPVPQTHSHFTPSRLPSPSLSSVDDVKIYYLICSFSIFSSFISTTELSGFFLRPWLITTFTSSSSTSSLSGLNSQREACSCFTHFFRLRLTLNSFVSLENYNLMINYEDVSVPHHHLFLHESSGGSWKWEAERQEECSKTEW